MKKLFIFSVCCLFLLQAQSQDYIPLVEDGKVWNMELVSTWQSWPDYGVVRTEKWELKGDTVIGGVSYIKYYEDGVYRGAMREADKKVYIYHRFDADNQESLLYDFSMKEGDRVSFNDIEFVLASEDYIESGNMAFRQMKLADVNNTGEINYWIEGVGALEGPLNPFYSMRTGGVDISITSCYVDEKCIYSRLADGIDLPSAVIGKESLIYDLHGRRLEQKPAKGIYIHNGKKMLVK